MVKNNKSQGMPINVIIIAALALIVLVVLATLLGGRLKIFSESLQSCAAKQGDCIAGDKCPTSKALVTNTDCKKGEVCCVQVFSSEK